MSFRHTDVSVARKLLWVRVPVEIVHDSFGLAIYAIDPGAKAYFFSVIQLSLSPSLQDARLRSESRS